MDKSIYHIQLGAIQATDLGRYNGGQAPDAGAIAGTDSIEANIWKEVLERGAAPIPAPLPPPVWNRLYGALDAFANFLAAHDEYADVFDRTAKAWQVESGLDLHFSGYFSPYYRNRVGQAGKDQKQIFQFCEPYFRYLANRHPELLALAPFARLAEGSLAALYSVYSAVLPLIDALRNVDKELLAALRPHNALPPIAIRLLQYEGDSQFFTDPHVDKSAITIITDTDDSVDDPCLVFGPLAPATPLLSQYAPMIKRKDESLLFLGAAAREAGFAAFRPAPHAVRPSREHRIRHSAIFFWLLPGIDLKLFSTSVPFTDDLGLSRNGHRQTS
jgi:hypothetical protein